MPVIGLSSACPAPFLSVLKLSTSFFTPSNHHENKAISLCSGLLASGMFQQPIGV